MKEVCFMNTNDPDFTNPGGYQPPQYQPPNYQQSQYPTPPSSPKRNWFRRHVVLLSILVVLVGLTLVFSGTIVSLVAPEYAVIQGAGKTMQALSQRMDATPYITTVQAATQVADNGQVTLSLQNGDEFFDATLQTDFSNRQFALQMDTEIDSTNAQVQAYLDRTCFVVASDQMQTPYGITFDTVEADLQSSVFAQYLDDTAQQEIVDLVTDYAQLLDWDDSQALDELESLTTNLLTDLELDSQLVKTDIGGVETRCTQYEVEFDEDDLSDFICGLMELAVHSNSLQNLQKINGTAFNPATYEQQLQLVQEAFANADLDGALSCYTYDSQIVKIQFAVEGVMDGEAVAVVSTLDFGKNPDQDDWVWYLMIDEDGNVDETQLVYSSQVYGTVYSDRWVISQNDVVFNDIQLTWDTQSGDLTITSQYAGIEDTFNANLQRIGDAWVLSLGEDVLGDGTTGTITIEPGNGVVRPSYVNLDQWTMADLDLLSAALF